MFVCVFVCVCVCARARMCVHIRVRAYVLTVACDDSNIEAVSTPKSTPVPNLTASIDRARYRP